MVYPQRVSLQKKTYIIHELLDELENTLDETHHSIYATSFGLISCDITGVIIERDFWNCIKAGPSLRILRCPEGTAYTRTISFQHQFPVFLNQLKQVNGLFQQCNMLSTLKFCPNQEEIECTKAKDQIMSHSPNIYTVLKESTV